MSRSGQESESTGYEPQRYRPGEYAREHIRITPTLLADGRQFFYLDDDPEHVSGAKTRELKDPRHLADRFAPGVDAEGKPIPVQAPQMRRDPLTGDWIPMATARMNRPITAGPGATAKGNPLAARKPGDPYQDGEVPDTDYDVVIFENRFPSMMQVPGLDPQTTYVDGNQLWPVREANGRCEVVCFDPDENSLPAQLPVKRLRTVVEAWAFRTAELSALDGIEQVFPFENHGQEIGVSLAHPHGQIYAYPFIPPRMEDELKQSQAYHERTGGNLLGDILAAELGAGERIVMRNHSWVAYVPAAARWPLEVHVAPVRDGVLSIDQLDDQERWDLAQMYSALLKRGNAFFDKGDGKGMDLPYIAAWHQGPVKDPRRSDYRLNLQFFSFRRAVNKVKYLAGSESGMAAWISDTTPERIAARFRETGPVDLSDED
ncbi:Galactose-1-phosphate uridylyltransferase [Bifidobacterium actinocoloniiforme DSM 22766]|uniref:Galactose-1-phosphate uridylyltransferase n=1 Tax=Bifidobacterium actinocoloniiforme DSM 22766 TaxID=1437605 RepID=A0A086YZE5_9BIFI|nr:galactose-1-phosphate uridylyltransferase [Bifidobacterium actinocoloniiforme]AKV54982.1 galactose-1-phosphate uridylyltransferase [Bifidobacterium actinocoloniiforme DSM 22766]KFI39645.1 Galactose-1-phosphate uridylyltransferase [Bifidobacterium actinocoloniiforme DSM 22766]